jgi:hypothetical protein
MIPRGEQGAGTVQNRLPRAGDNKLAATPGFKLAIGQGDRRDHDGVAVRAIKARDISHDSHTLSGPRVGGHRAVAIIFATTDPRQNGRALRSRRYGTGAIC